MHVASKLPRLPQNRCGNCSFEAKPIEALIATGATQINLGMFMLLPQGPVTIFSKAASGEPVE